MHVLLIGARASGKTTIGGRLAKELERPFVDLDNRTMARFEQSTVSAVWGVYGEPAWRTAEAAALRDVLAETEPQIVALGGGTPMIPDVQQQLAEVRAGGDLFVVFLRATPEELTRRLREAPGDRPSLTGIDIADEVAAVLQQRSGTYESLADLICDTDDLNESSVCSRVAQAVRGREARSKQS